MEYSKLYARFLICIFLRYDESKKIYHCFDLISHKLYVSCYVFFLENIHFFSISIESHNVSKSKLVHIDSFLDDTYSFPIQIGTLVLNHHPLSSPYITTLAPFETVDPFCACSSQCFRKSTRLPYFIYFSYLDSFTSFLSFIHNLSKPLSYKVVCDPLW